MPISKKNIKQSTEDITIHNKVSPFYKPVHVDGVYGGITPRGLLNVSFFSERFPIPKSTEFRIDHENKTVSKIKDSADSKNGIIREYEVGVYMNLETAKSLNKFLAAKIEELEKALLEKSIKK